jgi:hypothetical protein
MLLSRHAILLYLQLWSSSLVTALTSQPFFPSAVPLAVRSPTFNSWLNTRNGTNLMAEWPKYWNDQKVCIPYHCSAPCSDCSCAQAYSWAGFIRVDGVPYHWLGNYLPVNGSTLLGITVTPTRTILAHQAGPMQFNVTFLSPIEVHAALSSLRCIHAEDHAVRLAKRLGPPVPSIQLFIRGRSFDRREGTQYPALRRHRGRCVSAL